MPTDNFRNRLYLLVLLGCGLLTVSGCYVIRGSSGGGETRFEAPRKVEPSDVAVPQGYTIEAVVTGLTFPTGVAFDEAGRPYVVEAGYAYGEVFTVARLLRVDADAAPPAMPPPAESNDDTSPNGFEPPLPQGTVEIARGSHVPWNGVTFNEGAFIVAEGGQRGGGRIIRVSPDGEITPLIEDLPGFGDHHTNGPAIGPDGWIYFGQGTATNSGVVGPDNAVFGWLHRHPTFHDIPCEDVALAGRNFTSENPIVSGRRNRSTTGAFVPFGTATQEGQVVPGRVPCGGAVMRIAPDGGPPDLFAWGFRNPFGIAFSPDGRLFVADNGYDDRGSRPVWGTADFLWEVIEGTWYGWPDFAGGVPLNGGPFKPPRKQAPSFLLLEHPNEAPRPAARLGVHSSSSGLDFSRSTTFGYPGDAFIAQFGDMAPDVGKVLAPVGFQVVRVDVASGTVFGFAANSGGKVGPASRLGGGGFERPVAVKFSPDGESLYVVDFGVMTMSDSGPVPRPQTGVLWRIRREAP